MGRHGASQPAQPEETPQEKADAFDAQLGQSVTAAMDQRLAGTGAYSQDSALADLKTGRTERRKG